MKPEAESSEVPIREIEVATTLLFKEPKGSRYHSLRSRPKERLSTTKPGRNLILRSQHETSPTKSLPSKWKLRPLNQSRTSKEVATNRSGRDLNTH